MANIMEFIQKRPEKLNLLWVCVLTLYLDFSCYVGIWRGGCDFKVLV